MNLVCQVRKSLVPNQDDFFDRNLVGLGQLVGERE
jgi:hypothetical protein